MFMRLDRVAIAMTIGSSQPDDAAGRGSQINQERRG